MTITLKLSIDLELGGDERFTVQKLKGNSETVRAMLRAAALWLDSHEPMAKAFEDLKTLTVKEAMK